jgi:hypothetical protein
MIQLPRSEEFSMQFPSKTTLVMEECLRAALYDAWIHYQIAPPERRQAARNAFAAALKAFSSFVNPDS